MEQDGVKAVMSNNIKKLAEKHPLVFANMSEAMWSDLPDGWVDYDNFRYGTNYLLSLAYKF